MRDNGNVVLLPIAPDPDLDFTYQSYFRSKTANSTDRMDSGYQLVLNESGDMNVVRRNGEIAPFTNKTKHLEGDYYY